MKIVIVDSLELSTPWWIGQDGTLLLNHTLINDIEEAYYQATGDYYSGNRTVGEKDGEYKADTA